MKSSRLERLNGIQWSCVQIPLRPTFYSYFKESFSGEYHIYVYVRQNSKFATVLLIFSKFDSSFSRSGVRLFSK